MSEQVQLTEDDTEYCVVAVKHMFGSAIVFQFTCTNTVAEQVLESVTVEIESPWLKESVRSHNP